MGDPICFSPDLLRRADPEARAYQDAVDWLAGGPPPDDLNPCVDSDELPESFVINHVDPRNGRDVDVYFSAEGSPVLAFQLFKKANETRLGRSGDQRHRAISTMHQLASVYFFDFGWLAQDMSREEFLVYIGEVDWVRPAALEVYANLHADSSLSEDDRSLLDDRVLNTLTGTVVWGNAGVTSCLAEPRYSLSFKQELLQRIVAYDTGVPIVQAVADNASQSASIRRAAMQALSFRKT